MKKLVQAKLMAGLLLIVCSSPVLAQHTTNTRTGLPGRRISGGPRCGCKPSQPIVALIPSDYVGKTVRDRPSLHFIVPNFEPHGHEPGDRAFAIFELFDDRGQVIHTSFLKSDEIEDITSISLPESILQIGRSYRWVFSVTYQEGERSPVEIDVSGHIERVADQNIGRNYSEIEQLSSWENALSQAQHYQQAELWIDAVSITNELYKHYPNILDIQEAWQQMLEDLEVALYIDLHLSKN